jgi:hypothetical protein
MEIRSIPLSQNQVTAGGDGRDNKEATAPGCLVGMPSSSHGSQMADTRNRTRARKRVL